jgi:hypothetical protein
LPEWLDLLRIASKRVETRRKVVCAVEKVQKAVENRVDRDRSTCDLTGRMTRLP